MKRAALALMCLVCGASLLMVACSSEPPAKQPAAPYQGPSLAGYEAMKIPPDNPMTAARVELGKMLYYDKRMSGDGTLACYSCHLKENGLTDGKPTAIGAFGVDIKRAAPTMWNIGYHAEWYWDGRAKTLEGQAKAAWAGGNMGATGKDGKPSTDDICAKLNQIATYAQRFQAEFGAPCTPDNAAKALAAFMRTIVSEDAAWIHFKMGHGGLSEQAQRGYEIFKGKARCENCHSGLLLTDLQYHNTGVGMKAKEPDLGRHRVTNEERDKGAFKTPTLLDISKSAPYFHDGSVATLEEAVDKMLAGGTDNPWLDKANLRPPVKLTKAERDDLLAFLRALDANYKVIEPRLP